MKYDTDSLRDLPRLWKEKNDLNHIYVTEDGQRYSWFQLAVWPKNATHVKIVPTPLTEEETR